MKEEKNQSDNSEQEGFYANKIQIKEKDVAALTLRNWAKMIREANAFQSRYLPAAGAFRKQPQDALKFQPIIHIQQTENKSELKKDKKQKIRKGQGQHPHKLYARNQKFTLIYSRRKQEPILNCRFFLRNQVKLEHVGNPDVRAEKKMPSFQDRFINDVYGALPSRPNILKIDSRFQSGNLHCAYKNKQSEQYILFMENDTNSLGYNQWFYFSIEDTKANQVYTFRIVNFKKKHSFYKYGAKPYVYSTKEKKNGGDGWKKRGFNISYEESPIKVDDTQGNQYYCLSFDIKFEYEDDYVLVSMGLPYSYTKLTNFLKQISAMASMKHLIKVKIGKVCKSVGGNDVPQITISKKNASQTQKKMIIITARQHPGEVWSSFMAEGMIRHLLQMPHGWQKEKHKHKQEISWLLDKYVFKIYPMINVDGVIYGNFRCDLTGTDLNRRWKETSKLLHPQVFQIKQRIRSFARTYQIACCFDLHGHSKNFNIFCYSCKRNPETCRILPMMIQQKNPKFCFPSCTFGLSRYKQSTARAILFKILRNQNVLTIETSFYGSRLNGKIEEFNPKDIQEMAADIIDTLKPFLEKSGKIYLQAKQQIERNIEKYLSYDQNTENDSGSESDPEGDEIDLKDKLHDIFDSKFVNEDKLGIDNNEVDQVKATEQEDRVISKILEPVQITEPEFQFFTEIGSPKKVCVNYKGRKPLPLSKQFRTVQLKKQPQKNLHQDKVSPKDKTSRRIQPIKKTQPDYAQLNQNNFQRSPDKVRKTPVRTKTIMPKKKASLQSPQLTKNQVRLKRSIYSSLHQRTPLHHKIITPVEIQVDEPNKKDEDDEKYQIIHRKFNSAIKMSHKIHGALFDESIYNQDQSSLLNVLFNNKRMLEDEKQRRVPEIPHRQKRNSSRFRWQSSEKSDRMKILFNKSGNQLASIIANTPRRNL